MSFVVIFLGIMALLFALVFFTKRRFGVLGLALAAGAILSNLWVGELTPLIAEAGVNLVTPPLESVVAAALVLLPAVLLLAGGPTYKFVWQRIVASMAFATLATSFLLEPLGSALVIQDEGEQVYQFFVNNRVAIITTGLVLAVLDVLTTRTPKIGKNHAKH